MDFFKAYWVELIGGIIFLYIDLRLFIFFGVFQIIYILFKNHKESFQMIRILNLQQEYKLLSIIRKLGIPHQDVGNEIFNMKNNLNQIEYEFLIINSKYVGEEFNPLSPYSIFE